VLCSTPHVACFLKELFGRGWLLGWLGRDPPGRFWWHPPVSMGAGPTWQVGGRDPPGRLVGGTYLAGQGMGPTWQAGGRDPPGRPVGGTHLEGQFAGPTCQLKGRTHLAGCGRLLCRTHLSAVCGSHLAGLLVGPTWHVVGGWCEGSTCQVGAGSICHLLVKVNGCVLPSMSPICQSAAT
jgi:hypothetical protein